MEPTPAMSEPVPTGEPSAPSGAGRSASARAGLAKGATAALTVLQKAVPIAARLVGVMNVYSWIVIGATVVIVLLSGLILRPVTVGSVVPFLVFVVLLAIPGLSLRLFHGALVEVLAMPDFLRQSPDLVRNHGTELAQLVGQAASHSRDRLTSVPGDIFKSGRLLMRAHGDLPEYGRMVRLINVPFLFVVFVSFLVGFALIAFALLLIVTTPIVLVVQ